MSSTMPITYLRFLHYVKIKIKKFDIRKKWSQVSKWIFELKCERGSLNVEQIFFNLTYTAERQEIPAVEYFDQLKRCYTYPYAHASC